jgi:hypothetical protein
MNINPTSKRSAEEPDSAPEPVISRRELLETTIGVFLLAGTQEIVSGVGERSDIRGSTQTKSESWESLDNKFIRYNGPESLELNSPVPDYGYPHDPDKFPVIHRGDNALRTQSRLQYLGTSFEEFGNPSDKAQTKVGWKHTFSIDSIAIGLKPWSIINVGAPESWKYVARPPDQIQTTDVIWGPSINRSSHGLVWDDIDATINQLYNNIELPAEYYRFYHKNASEFKDWSEYPFEEEWKGRKPNNHVGGELGVNTDLEISTALKNDPYSDSIAISLRRDKDTFIFTDTASFLQGLTNKESIKQLQQFIPSTKESPGFNPRESFQSFESHSRNEPFDRFNQIESQIEAAQTGSARLSLAKNTVGTSLALAGLLSLGIPLSTSIGLGLTVYGFIQAFNTWSRETNDNPTDILPYYRGVHMSHPQQSAHSDPISGTSAIFDIYSAPNKQGIATVRVKHPRNRIEIPEDERRGGTEEYNKCIWFIHIPALPDDPAALDGDEMPIPRLIGPNYSVNCEEDDSGNCREWSHLIPDDMNDNNNGVNDGHQININHDADLAQCGPVASFDISWDSKQSLQEFLTDEFDDTEVPPNIGDLSNLADRMANAIERFREQNPSVGERVWFDPSSTKLGGAPMRDYSWKLYRIRYEEHTTRQGQSGEAIPFSLAEITPDTGDVTGETIFGSSCEGRIEHEFQQPGQYRMELTVSDERTVSEDSAESGGISPSRHTVTFTVTANNADGDDSSTFEVDLHVDEETKPIGEEFRFSAEPTGSENFPTQPIPWGVYPDTNPTTNIERGRYAYDWSIVWDDSPFRIEGTENLRDFQQRDNPLSPILDHAFDRSGEYEVAVRATDLLSGAMAQDHVTVTVEPSVYSSSTIIENFEEGLDAYKGRINSFGLISNPTFNGERALENRSNNTLGGILNEDIVISVGDTIGIMFRHASSDSDINVGFLDSLQRSEGYIFAHNNTRELIVSRHDAEQSSILAHTGWDATPNTWYELVIDWTENELTLSVRDTSGTALTSISASDDRYSSGYLSFVEASPNNTQYFDYVRRLGNADQY